MENLDITADANLTTATSIDESNERMIIVQSGTLKDIAPETLLKSISIASKYIITPSVSSNNLVLAIKYIDGNDPSSTNKLKFRVGDTEYSLTSATSFTKNAGTNWMNLGAAELAALPHDLFVYAIGETGASAGLKFGYSRISHAVTMNDFVNTSTDEKYIAGNWTNFNATDAVTVIGRFRAQLSAGAGYTWSIPTAKVISYPIHESDFLSWTPTYSATSPMTWTSVTTAHALYKVMRNNVIFSIRASGTTGGTASPGLTFTTPLSHTSSFSSAPVQGSAGVTDGGNTLSGYFIFLAANTVTARKYDSSNFALAVSRQVNGSGSMPI